MKTAATKAERAESDVPVTGDLEWTQKRLRELSTPLPVGREDRVRDEDVDFIRDCRVLLKRKRLGVRRWIPWIVLAVVASLIWWASWAELEEVTRGVGKVIPSKSVQYIQSLEGGILEEMLVEEGDQVSPGQPLIRIQSTIYLANYEEKVQQRNELIARLARHWAEAQLFADLVFEEGVPDDIAKVERTLFETRKADFETNKAALASQLALARKEEELLKDARSRKAISPVELIRVQKEVAQLGGQLQTLSTGIVKDAMQQYEIDRAALLALDHGIKRDKDRLDRTVISCPVRGTVNKIHINTVGRVIASGVDIMEIVPLDDTLLIEANVRPADVAFIRPGQKATVKFTAYDFAVYGGLDGVVEQMSVDTITDDRGESFYQIKVRTEAATLGKDRHGEDLAIMPGMVAEVDLLTGKKTVLNYLLRPINRAHERALRER